MVVTKGLLARVHAKPDKVDDVEAFLVSALSMARDEPLTTAWFALKFNRHEFGIFDVFADDTGRDAHLTGPIAVALMANASTLLSEPPKIEKIDVLASHLATLSTPVGANKALLLTFAAKAGHSADVESFLQDAAALAAQEPGTLAWFAIRLPDGSYGIFDTFADNAGRFAHIAGRVPRELAMHALTLLGSFPDMSMVDVLAEKR